MIEWKVGVSIVTACMNREENLLKVIPTWLNSSANEIIIVDWSSSVPLHRTLKNEGVTDDRIFIYRVEGEERWILTHAYNVGLKRATNGVILKLDNDHSITTDFFAVNDLNGLDTRLGSWRLAKSMDQAYINGAFLIRAAALRDIGFFNELITTYGWDDSYLHETLFANGARIGHLCPDSIRHIEQEEETRTKFQRINKESLVASFLGVKPTEFMNRRNMYLTSLLPRQTGNVRQSTYRVIDDTKPRMHVLERQANPHLNLPPSYIELADRLAFRDFYCWNSGMQVDSTCISEIEDQFTKATEYSEQQEGSTGCVPRETDSINEKTPSGKSPFSESKIIRSLMSKFVPLMLSAYGHTDNSKRYQLISDLNKDFIEDLNLTLPSWCRDKVKFASTTSIDQTRVQIDTSRRGIHELVGKLLLGTKEENQYFFAAFNSMDGAHKRCLYEFLESAGRPYKVLSSYYLNCSISSDEIPLSPEDFLKAVGLIFPHRNTNSFIDYARRFNQKLIAIHGSNYRLSDSVITNIAKTVTKPSLTLVTSLFKGLKYMIEYSLNLKRMHLFHRTEILIYIVPSSEAEETNRYLTSFFRNDRNVIIKMLDDDPGLYECWNMGIQKAQTRYISNANADDRRGRYHSDYLIFSSEVEELDAVSSALLTDIEPTYDRWSATQDVWFTGMKGLIAKKDLFIEKEEGIESQNLLHCMPIWRKDLHDKLGFFDESQYGTSCDWEFWLRCASNNAKMKLVDIPLGFYLLDRKSHNRRNSDERKEGEHKIVDKHIDTSASIGRLQ